MSKYPFLKDKCLLITGGTGSFGKNCVKKILEDDNVRKVIILSRDEWKQWEMRRSEPIFQSQKTRYFLGDIRDKDRLMRAFHEVDYVIHAAALKQVPAAEYNPSEFVNTNIIGAMNIIDAAIDNGVKKVIALSTDKAVNPVNLYGATKLCSDKLFVAGNVYVGARGFPTFSVVRYGNVLASRGSVIHHWKNLFDQGEKEIPITDEKMTRFWITLDQAVDFVLKHIEDARGGEIYIPKIPSMHITDLAKAVYPGVPHKIIGIREGEKLHELMISGEDARHTLEFDQHYIIVPEIYIKSERLMKNFLTGREGKKVPLGFAYTSDTNTQWMGVEQLQKILNIGN